MEMLGAMSAGVSTITQREFLTFTLDPEEYGLDILKVQEIRSYDTVKGSRHCDIGAAYRSLLCAATLAPRCASPSARHDFCRYI